MRNIKKIICLLMTGLFVGSLCGCGHQHTWKEATCITPKTCSECGETEGNPVEHIWIAATCTEAKICKNCETTDGVALGHTLGKEKIVQKVNCAQDGITESMCSVCGETFRNTTPATGNHKIKEWKTTKNATCTKKGTKKGACSVCKETTTKSIPKTKHVDDNNWVIIEAVSVDGDGLKGTHCKNCGKVMREKTISLTVEERNAIREAENYIDTMPFSRSGLIDQLEYEGYSTESAVMAVDSLNINWKEQAAREAKNYIDTMSFSRSGLIDQLLYEGYTQEQALYGVAAVGY